MYKVIGIKKIDYVNKNNKRIVGTELHVTFKEQNIDGLGCERLYFSNRVDFNAKLGDEIDVFYDKYGNIIAFNVAERK